MRIAIVSRIYRPEPSAASSFLGAVADEATSRGHDVTVVTVRPPAGLAADNPVESVRMLPVLRDRSGYVKGYLQYLSFDVPLFFRLLVLRRPDVVLMEPPPTTGLVVRMACALRRIPYVYDAADVWSDAAEQATGSKTVIRVLRAMERFAMQGARSLVTISQGVMDRVRAMGVDRPMTVTGFGADTTSFLSPSETTAPTDRVFLYAGTYSPWHGADAAIDAFTKFSRSHPGYRLRFIGNGSERELLERRTRELGVESTVDFVETVPSEELLPELHHAVATIATLRPGTGYEYAFTTKAYSSMAAGCPVIFAGPGPTATFLDRANGAVRAGVVCDYDADAIAEAMVVLADAPLSAGQRQALAAWTAEEHSLAAVAARVVDVVQAAATDSDRRS
ncbi:glycosyltransferase family 4 protein [Microbacterium profundi]|uniref:glycosyltransferase family 4 protein n=1 Tax=Microbacterium profundi TaxID=450380 RepID=UPI0027DFD864|nr:glycosyltransferase family 4 protein [Microbacterium profundi]MCE7480323.1 glycosyltransferase family 4 protein [Microbacterium profundi]